MSAMAFHAPSRESRVRGSASQASRIRTGAWRLRLVPLLLAALPRPAAGNVGAASLADLTRDLDALRANQQQLLQEYCPSGDQRCKEDKSSGLDISTIGGFLFTACVGLAVGTDVTFESFMQVLRHSKRGFIIGIVSQFGFMPLYAFLFSLVFKADMTSTALSSYEACVLGMMIVGCLPGGNTSNLFTWFCGGNVSLSICMSLASNIAAVGMLPLLLSVYFKARFTASEQVPDVPYVDILVPLVITVACILTGMTVRARGSPDVIWWTAKLSSLVALFFLVLAVLIGVVKYPHVITQPSYALWLYCLSVQPAGYLAGWGLATLCRCSLRTKLTIAFETGVQSFALGLVMSNLGFNAEPEVCQFDPRCMSLLSGDNLHNYEFAWSGGGRIRLGDGVGQITSYGFLPGEAGNRAVGGCCRFNELVYLDVFKYSAICSLLYPLHAYWMIRLLRKVFPGGFPRCSDTFIEEKWEPAEPRRKVVLAAGRCEPAFAPSGFGSAQEAPAVTLVELLSTAASRCGKEWALGQEWPVEPYVKGQSFSRPWSSWRRWTWAEYKAEVDATAGAFVHLGLEADGSVAIYGFNAPRWNIAALAAMTAGAKCCGIYPTDTLDQVIYKIRHSSASIAVVEDNKKLQLFAKGAESMPQLQAVLMYADTPELQQISRMESQQTVPVYTWEKMLSFGGGAVVKQRSKRLTPGTPACLVYTSGTTGMPKAVMLSHDNICFMARGVLHVNRHKLGAEYEQERVLSYLPLSHVAGFQNDITFPIALTACTKGYVTVYAARPYDFKEGSLKERLQFVRPTVFLGVPRVWEKFHEGLKAAGRRAQELRGLRAQMPIICCVRKSTAARWAKDQGLRSALAHQYGASGRTTAFLGLADALVLSNIRSALGLDTCKYAATGAAPIMLETVEAFASYGIQVNEMYGMSESTAYGTISSDALHSWGSCGFASPGGQIGIFRYADGNSSIKTECPRAKDLFNPTEVEQGEICFRGRHVMMGYMGNPDMGEESVREAEQKTAEAIDDEGWLRSGDMGCMDERGFVRVTGRYKELIITAGGENVAPVPIEESIKKLCPAISNVMMVGDKRKFNTCLVTLKVEDPEQGERLHRAALVVSGVETVSQAKESADFRAIIQNAIDATNKDSKACPSNASKVQKFAILSGDFTLEGGELTPTLKLRRRAVEETRAQEIAQLYAGC